MWFHLLDCNITRKAYLHKNRPLKDLTSVSACYCPLLTSATYTNPIHFSQNSFISEISCLFTLCPYSVNVTQSTWKCVVTLVKQNICVKIHLDANIQARKAALVRNYFSRRNNFCINLFLALLSLSRLAIFNKINTDALFSGVIYLHLATFTFPIVFLYPVSTWMAVNGFKKLCLRSTKVYTWLNFYQRLLEDRPNLC